MPTDDSSQATGSDVQHEESLKYVLGDRLGEGAFAVVYKCEYLGETIAAKVVSRKKKYVWIGGKSVPAARAFATVLVEVEALRQLGSHTNIIAFKGFVEEEERALLLLELAADGTLDDLLHDHPDGLEPSMACALSKQLLQALAHCHTHGVVHRDIKLANLLLAAGATLKVCDFGQAGVFDPDEEWELHRLHERFGTERYCAPEIISSGPEGYLGPPVDMWSAGVCIYVLLCGHMPFALADAQADWRFARVAEAQSHGNSTAETIFSWFNRSCPWREEKALVDALLLVDASERLSAAKALETAWCAQQPDTPPDAPTLRRTPSLQPTKHAGRIPLTRRRSGLTDLSMTKDSVGQPWRGACGATSDAQADAADAAAPKPSLMLPSDSGGLDAAWNREAALERACLWRAVETFTRADEATTDAYPASSVRYSVMRHVAFEQALWLRPEHSDRRLPIIEVDRPFKVGLANNNNYAWGVTASAPPESCLGKRKPSGPSQHPSRRTCPFGAQF